MRKNLEIVQKCGPVWRL